MASRGATGVGPSCARARPSCPAHRDPQSMGPSAAAASRQSQVVNHPRAIPSDTQRRPSLRHSRDAPSSSSSSEGEQCGLRTAMHHSARYAVPRTRGCPIKLDPAYDPQVYASPGSSIAADEGTAGNRTRTTLRRHAPGSSSGSYRSRHDGGSARNLDGHESC